MNKKTGRETFLVKVDWVNDWLVFNDGKNITLRTRGRDAVEQLLAQESRPGNVRWQAAFDKPELELGWYQKSASVHLPLPLHGTSLEQTDRQY